MARAKKIAEAKDKDGNVVMQFMVPAAEQDALSLCLRILTHQLQLKAPDDQRGGGGLFGGEFGYGVDFENDVFLMHHYCWCERDDCLWCGGSGCQGDNPREPHRPGCYQDRQQAYARKHGELLGVYDGRESWYVPYGNKKHAAFTKKLCAEMGLEYPGGSAVHCTCGVNDEWKARYDACQCEWHTGQGIYRFGAATSAPNFWHKASGFRMRWYKYIGRDNDVDQEPRVEITLHQMFSEVLASIGAPSLEECATAYEKAEEESAERARKSMEFAFSDEGRKVFDDMIAKGVVKIL